MFKLCFVEKRMHTNTWQKPLYSLYIALQYFLQLFSVGFQFFRLKLQMFDNPLKKIQFVQKHFTSRDLSSAAIYAMSALQIKEISFFVFTSMK